MGYSLSTEELGQEFGDVDLEVISYKENIRTSCVRRALDGAVMAYSTVLFHDENVALFSQEFHKQILSGMKLGETIRNSGMSHERVVSEPFTVKINFGLAFLFNTKKGTCLTRKVDYKVKDIPYASITEFYNPEFVTAKMETPPPGVELLTNKNSWFVIDQLKPGFEEEYLRLAHGFLKKSVHVGIEDEATFINETRQTIELLIRDINTKLFIVSNDKMFIGYAAINIHPALHINGLECVIRELYVKSDCQRKGVGTSLMSYVEQYARKLGCKRMSLATNWNDEQLKNFYGSIGFLRRCDFIIKKL